MDQVWQTLGLYGSIGSGRLTPRQNRHAYRQGAFMDFGYSPQVQALQLRLQDFMDRYVLPYNGAWHHAVAQGVTLPPL